MTLLARSALLLVLTACAGAPDRPPASALSARDLEPVLSWRVEADTLFVRVASNGCTSKESFEPEVYLSPRWVALVELERVEPDACEAHVPGGVVLEWTRAELGVPASAAIELANPVRGRG